MPRWLLHSVVLPEHGVCKCLSLSRLRLGLANDRRAESVVEGVCGSVDDDASVRPLRGVERTDSEIADRGVDVFMPADGP